MLSRLYKKIRAFLCSHNFIDCDIYRAETTEVFEPRWMKTTKYYCRYCEDAKHA